MSIRTSISGYLDKIVDARFKRDAAGQLVFFPWGFGTGRVVPDAAVEAMLRQGVRRMMIGIFVVMIPLISMINGAYQLRGIASLCYFLGCVVLGFASQLYTVWLSRGLARSNERLTYAGAMSQSLDRFGKKFLIFGLTSCLLATLVGLITLSIPQARAAGDPVAMVFIVIVCAPLSIAYAIALRRRNRNQTSAR